MSDTPSDDPSINVALLVTSVTGHWLGIDSYYLDMDNEFESRLALAKKIDREALYDNTTRVRAALFPTLWNYNAQELCGSVDSAILYQQRNHKLPDYPEIRYMVRDWDTYVRKYIEHGENAIAFIDKGTDLLIAGSLSNLQKDAMLAFDKRIVTLQERTKSFTDNLEHHRTYLKELKERTSVGERILTSELRQQGNPPASGMQSLVTLEWIDGIVEAARF